MTCNNKWHKEEQHLEVFCPDCNLHAQPESLVLLDEIRADFLKWYDKSVPLHPDEDNSAEARSERLRQRAATFLWTAYRAGYMQGKHK